MEREVGAGIGDIPEVMVLDLEVEAVVMVDLEVMEIAEPMILRLNMAVEEAVDILVMEEIQME